eukprot:CAMPEP_0184488966 /NCGR_PEP_ID=MMETSP0113_2-20130426/13988_1 /TAXON_ID=91329 /ORGANISM="Norrisiella sphaerica, Strain BC52" /LENGTH=218 /DNA_ID=CAMNT_0026872109 /DNA_START=56 /DNA_END=712 /DNA_ORIENTATION=+
MGGILTILRITCCDAKDVIDGSAYYEFSKNSSNNSFANLVDLTDEFGNTSSMIRLAAGGAYEMRAIPSSSSIASQQPISTQPLPSISKPYSPTQQGNSENEGDENFDVGMNRATLAARRDKRRMEKTNGVNISMLQKARGNVITSEQAQGEYNWKLDDDDVDLGDDEALDAWYNSRSSYEGKSRRRRRKSSKQKDDTLKDRETCKSNGFRFNHYDPYS